MPLSRTSAPLSAARPATLLLLILLALASACGGRKPTPIADDPLRMFLRLDQTEFRPGEAVVAELILLNVGPDDLPLTPLNIESLTFYHGDPGTGKMVEVVPVYSEKEPMLEIGELQRGGDWSRQFVFTTVTAAPGVYTLQAAYSSDPGALIGKGPWIAVTRDVGLTVAGEPAVRRDADGVLLSEEAVEMARAALQAPGAPVKTRLIRNEAGFLDWLAVVGMPDGTSRGLLINPYLATIRKEVDPAGIPEPQETPVPRVFNDPR